MFGNMLLSKEICNFPASPETIDKTLCLVLISGSCHKQNVYFCRCITLGSNPAGLNLNLRHSTAHTQIETWKWWPVLIALMRGDFLGSPPDKFILFRHYAHRETHTLTVWLRQTSFNWTPKKSSEGWWAYSHFWHQEIIVIWRRNSKRVSPPTGFVFSLHLPLYPPPPPPPYTHQPASTKIMRCAILHLLSVLTVVRTFTTSGGNWQFYLYRLM